MTTAKFFVRLAGLLVAAVATLAIATAALGPLTAQTSPAAQQPPA